MTAREKSRSSCTRSRRNAIPNTRTADVKAMGSRNAVPICAELNCPITVEVIVPATRKKNSTFPFDRFTRIGPSRTARIVPVEIGPALSRNQQRFAMLGLLISGGMLIHGNIPNIVAASRLGITSREWARHGLRRDAASHPVLRSFESHGRFPGRSDLFDQRWPAALIHDGFNFSVAVWVGYIALLESQSRPASLR